MGYRTTSFHRRGTTGIRRSTTTRRRRQKRPPEGLIVAAFLAVGIVAVAIFYVLSLPESQNRHNPQARVPAGTEGANPGRSTGVDAQPPCDTAPQTKALPTPTPVKPVASAPTQPATVKIKPTNPPNIADSVVEAPVVPWQDDPSSRHSSVPAPTAVREGWFEIPTTMPTLPTVRCDYRIPLGPTGRPLATAADIVLIFPYPAEQAAIKGLGTCLTSKWGFTTVSLQFPGMWPVRRDIAGEIQGWYYYYPESGSGLAWKEAIRRVRAIGGFPDRLVFATGRSGGGAAAGLFAEAYPQQVAAVANEAGRLFPQTSRFKGPLLLMHGAHDYVAEPIRTFMQQARLTGVDVGCYTYPPSWGGRGRNPIWQHGIHGSAEQAMWRWLVDVADMRLEHGAIPPMAKWGASTAGVPYSSQSMRELMEAVTPAADFFGNPDGRICIARPAKAVVPKGAVVFIGTDTVDMDELALDAECLADQGWVAIAVAASGRSVASALRQISAKSETAKALGSPWYLVVDGADEISPILSLRPQPVGIAACRASSFSSDPKAVPPPGIKLLLLDSPNVMLDAKSPEIKRVSVQAADQPGWHRERCAALAQQLERWGKK